MRPWDSVVLVAEQSTLAEDQWVLAAEVSSAFGSCHSEKAKEYQRR